MPPIASSRNEIRRQLPGVLVTPGEGDPETDMAEREICRRAVRADDLQ
jgi:hypothetical protein